MLVAALAGGSIVALGAEGGATHGSVAAPSGLDVLPFPGTEDASPKSQISFPALIPSQLRTVVVRGSRTGVHAGLLSALPDRRGSAFAADRPFTAGEQVSVSTALSSPEAGTASGAPNATHLSFKFTVATSPASAGQPVASTPTQGSRAAKPPATQSFHSSSRANPKLAHAMGLTNPTHRIRDRHATALPRGPGA